MAAQGRRLFEECVIQGCKDGVTISAESKVDHLKSYEFLVDGDEI